MPNSRKRGMTSFLHPRPPNISKARSKRGGCRNSCEEEFRNYM